MKKKWKILLCLFVVAVLLVAAVFFFGRSNAFPTMQVEEVEETVEVQVGIGETVEYAQLTAVRGNEISYLLAQEDETASGKENSGNQNKGDRENQFTTGRDNREEGGMPDMSEMMSGMGNGEMPDMSEMMSGMGNGGMFGGMLGASSIQVQEDDGTFTYNGVSYKVTETEMTELIPVGTDVTTKLGTVTTFSRLRAGDNVAIVRDNSTGEIVAVYIIG